jgi:multiple sugar transport system permease protein
LEVAIATLAIFCLAPILWQLLTSFKVDADIVGSPRPIVFIGLTLDRESVIGYSITRYVSPLRTG